MKLPALVMILLFQLFVVVISVAVEKQSTESVDTSTIQWTPPTVQTMPTPENPFFFPSIQKTFGTVLIMSVIIPAAEENGLDYYVPGFRGADIMFSINRRIYPQIYGDQSRPIVVELDNVTVAAGHFSIDDWHLLPRARRAACFVAARHPVVRCCERL